MTNSTGKAPSDQDIAWLKEVAKVEEPDEFPAVTGRPHGRTALLRRIPGEFKDWVTLENAVRPEVPRQFLVQMKQALSVDLYPAAMRAAWDAVIDDLRKKVLAFGLQHFASVEGMPPIRSEADLHTQMTAHHLLLGAYKLHLLDEEAYVQLSHCMQLVMGYAQSNQFASELDRLEVLNFVKNCVKYSLAVDGPQPGFDIKGLFERIENEDLTARLPEFEQAIARQPVDSTSTIARLLFRAYVEFFPTATRDANILRLFPHIWHVSTEQTRAQLGSEFVRIRLNGTNDQAGRAWSLIQLVQGASYLPDDFLARYFDQLSDALLSAHNGVDNFYNEVEPAQRLLSLGARVPSSARSKYVRAVAVCFLGNHYGVSFAALPSLTTMLERFDAELVKVLLRQLLVDPDLRTTLLSERPAQRLPALLQLVESRISTEDGRRTMEFFTTKAPRQIVEYFNTLGLTAAGVARR
jgi:hypothetical protein